MANNLIFFVPYHTGYAHAEFVRSFSSFTDLILFIYKWNPARDHLQELFGDHGKIHLDEFSIENILRRMIEYRDRKIVVLLTASTNYLFGQLQVRLFREIQQYVPWLIDVYPVGHCMYGCQSCAYAYTHRIPMSFTNYIRHKHEPMKLDNDFEIIICPSYSFEGAPFSFLSNEQIVDYISQLTCSHAIKLHPLAYDALNNQDHPFLSLTDLEKAHVAKLSSQSNAILPCHYTNTLKLIEHARVVICDSNSSIPFESLYFQDKKYIFVYETSDEYDEEDDRQQFFHKFQNVDQLNDLLQKYLQQKLECKTEESHAFFLEKYDEPDGNEIEHLAEVRQWNSGDHGEREAEESLDISAIKQSIQNEFQSSLTPMALYALGDHTMLEVLQHYFNDEDEIFDTMQQNASEL